MNKIDLAEEHQGCLCLMCETFGENKISQLYAKDIGPVCHECFQHTLVATREIHWVSLTTRPAN